MECALKQSGPIYQKKPHVRKSSTRNSGAGNGCANFMGAWHFPVLSAGKPLMPIKFVVWGGGGLEPPPPPISAKNMTPKYAIK